MQPEISHRCASCGAAIREAAMFCPECGQALTPTSKGSEPQTVAETAPPSAIANGSAEGSAAAVEESSNASTAEPPAPKVEPAPPKGESDSSARHLSAEASAVSKPGKYGKARDSLHRASTATRDALADNVKRVEKIRHVSTAMFEEASYDPSLRFVLVALGLFVVFLVLLLLSKVMG